MRSRPSVYDYSEPVEFLLQWFKSTQEKYPGFSLRAWSKAIGLSQPTALSMVLRRRRSLSLSLAKKISDYLTTRNYFKEPDSRYFLLLSISQKCNDIHEKELFQDLLSKFHPEEKFHYLEVEKFRTISDWHHIAILEILAMKNRPMSAKELHSLLGESKSEEQIEKALERLCQLELVKETEVGFTREQKSVLSIMPTEPEPALKGFHKEMLKKADRALDEIQREQRDFSGFMLPICRQKVNEAAQLIAKFRKSFSKEMKTNGKGDDVYFLGIQFFSVLENKKGTENEKH